MGQSLKTNGEASCRRAGSCARGHTDLTNRAAERELGGPQSPGPRSSGHTHFGLTTEVMTAQEDGTGLGVWLGLQADSRNQNSKLT